MDNFEPGTVSAFVRGKFYLARLEDGGFLAMSRTCTHLSCTVPWVSGEDKFICPCHSSEFDIRGEVINPPAPRALDLYPVTIENKVLKVDTGKLTGNALNFPAEQVTYPKQHMSRLINKTAAWEWTGLIAATCSSLFRCQCLLYSHFITEQGLLNLLI